MWQANSKGSIIARGIALVSKIGWYVHEVSLKKLERFRSYRPDMIETHFCDEQGYKFAVNIE